MRSSYLSRKQPHLHQYEFLCVEVGFRSKLDFGTSCFVRKLATMVGSVDSIVERFRFPKLLFDIVANKSYCEGDRKHDVWGVRSGKYHHMPHCKTLPIQNVLATTAAVDLSAGIYFPLFDANALYEAMKKLCPQGE
ncbi:conserved hypothetical protein [Trichinella spiralis]|uniref:hypothetical protein n=1 Tax=Trichinella spiralis TaxID=6334 RepID=UPI0001EFC0E4|nr:conserved hypothetical protein [Trichinella spiralis]